MRILLALCVIFVIMGAIGQADYRDEIDAAEFYCDDVKRGYIPNYKDLNC